MQVVCGRVPGLERESERARERENERTPRERESERAREYKPFCCLLVLLLLLLLLLLLASQPIIRRTFSACVCFVTFVSVYLCA